MTQAMVPQAGDTQVYLQGISTNLKVGDALLFVSEEAKRLSHPATNGHSGV